MSEKSQFNEKSAVILTPEARVEIALQARRRKKSSEQSILTLLEFLEYNPDNKNPSSKLERDGMRIVEYSASAVPPEAVHLVDGVKFALSIDLLHRDRPTKVDYQSGKFIKT